MAQSLIQNVVDTIDSAHMQRGHLTELLSTLKEAKEQVNCSAASSRQNLQEHFSNLQTTIIESLNKQLHTLLQEVDQIEMENVKSLSEFEDTVQESLQTAIQVMDEGKKILSNNPNENLESLVKFKDNPQTKNLECIPESPCLSDVPYISVVLGDGLSSKVSQLVSQEGRVIERAPVQITDILERPGSLLIKWAEVDDEVEASEFCLQYCYGNIKYNNLSQATFHTAYTGSGTSHIVRHLRTDTEYSFRVCCRGDNTTPWSVWSIPRVGTTSISHYKWNTDTEGYTTSNEGKTATRGSCDETKVLYSDTCSYTSGYPITFKVLDAGENSPLDGIGLALTNQDSYTMKRKDAIFVATRGMVYVDGQEMKTKLPPLARGSKLVIETEYLTNGKLRVSVEVEGKEVKFDWKIEDNPSVLTGALITSDPSKRLYFGMLFSHEDWKIGLE